MADVERKPLNEPDESRPIDKGTVEIVKIGGSTVMRTTFQPGWKWSECVKPVAGTDSCQVDHLGYCVSGQMRVRMNDGTELEFFGGDAMRIPPGHDAWVVGDEPYVGVDFTGGEQYAKPS